VADIVTQEDLTALLRFDERVAAAVRKIFSLTKREVVGGNPLIGEQCVGRLADEFGLKGEAVVSLDDVADQLGSYRGQRLADYAGVVGKRKIWVFTSQKAAVLA
jgi:hypothetical protein